MFQKINWYRQVWLAVVGRSPAGKSFCFCRHLPTLLAGTPVGRISSRLRVVFTMWSADEVKDQLWMWPCCPEEQVSPLFIGHFFNMSLENCQSINSLISSVSFSPTHWCPSSSASSSHCSSWSPPAFYSPSFSSSRTWCRACAACVSERTWITTNLKIIKNK